MPLELLRRYLPAPPPKMIAGPAVNEDERATPEEVAQIQDAIAALSGRRCRIRCSMSSSVASL